MNTSKYDADTRKNVKRFQRTPGYLVMKKEHLAERERLHEVIKRLTQKLLEAGVSAADVAKLAA